MLQTLELQSLFGKGCSAVFVWLIISLIILGEQMPEIALKIGNEFGMSFILSFRGLPTRLIMLPALTVCKGFKFNTNNVITK